MRRWRRKRRRVCRCKSIATAARCLRAIREGKVKSVDGNDIPVRAESICIHSDTPGAVSMAKGLRSALTDDLDKAT